MPARDHRWHAPLLYSLVSLALLLPCYWQPRLHGGDLSSNVQNAWLESVIERGAVQGLVHAHQWTNILFEIIQGSLHQVLGAEAAQRIAVSIAVLTFVWGAFAFISVVAGNKPWHLAPCIAMLAYGWAFHMGFFDFYLSLGLCFWALALAWRPNPLRWLGALALFFVAGLAHALPVVWTVGLLAYVYLARWLSLSHRGYLTAAFVVTMVLLHLLSGRLLFQQESPTSVASAGNLDRAWVLGTKYYILLMALVVVWGLLFMALLRKCGALQVVCSIPFQACIVSAAGVFILPVTVLIPGLFHGLSYVGERMSLGVAIFLCAMLGAVRPKWPVRYALAVVALTFFAFVYWDERARNSFEDRMQDVVAQVEIGHAGKPVPAALP